MAWTAADVTALKAAIATGVKSVSYAGPPMRTIVYASVDEMLKVLALMQAEVDDTAGTRTSVRYPIVSKGF